MKILMLNYEYPPLGGGAAPVCKELAEKYAEKGHEVDVVTMQYSELPARQEVNDNLTVHRVPSLRSSQSSCSPVEMLSFLPIGLFKTVKLSKQKEYDINHTHFILPTGIISYILKKTQDLPYIVTIHGSDVPGYNPDRFGILHRVTQPVWKTVVGSSEKIVSPSNYLRRLILETCSEADVEVIPNGFDSSAYDPTRKKEERILLTSRLFERKGVQHFLDAVTKTETDWDVVITGEGHYRQELEQKAEKLDTDVDFVGWVDRKKLKQLLETSSVYVFPSNHENCPVALQEAMASGNAIIASDKSGTAELVGDAGITVEPTDTGRFSRQINRLVNDSEKRDELAQKARSRISSEFNWEKIYTRYEKYIKQ